MKCNDYELVCMMDNLYDAFVKTTSSSRWKEPTQRFIENYLPELRRLHLELCAQTYKPITPTKFIHSERGKIRLVESANIRDKIVQRCLCDQVLLPRVRPKLIYDNAASLEDRGVGFFRKRLDYHLQEFTKEHGTDGYILTIDFRKFFDNLQHDVLMDMYRKIIPDERVLNLLQLFMDQNIVDVSYMSDEEYANCMNVPFNSIAYLDIPKELKTGEKFMRKSMGIGSQISQISGVLYPHRVDNYCKIVRGIRGYGRYMDDIYIIHESKEYLWELLGEIMKICKEYGLFINQEKTQIVSLKHRFTILKIMYIVYPDGTIVHIPNTDSFRREKRKLTKQSDELLKGMVTIKEIENGYLSWRGNIVKYDNKLSVQEMDNLYNRLYIEPFILKGGNTL